LALCVTIYYLAPAAVPSSAVLNAGAPAAAAAAAVSSEVSSTGRQLEVAAAGVGDSATLVLQLK
jgi:hypothetical protein